MHPASPSGSRAPAGGAAGPARGPANGGPPPAPRPRRWGGCWCARSGVMQRLQPAAAQPRARCPTRCCHPPSRVPVPRAEVPRKAAGDLPGAAGKPEEGLGASAPPPWPEERRRGLKRCLSRSPPRRGPAGRTPPPSIAIRRAGLRGERGAGAGGPAGPGHGGGTCCRRDPPARGLPCGPGGVVGGSRGP